MRYFRLTMKTPSLICACIALAVWLAPAPAEGQISFGVQVGPTYFGHASPCYSTTITYVPPPVYYRPAPRYDRPRYYRPACYTTIYSSPVYYYPPPAVVYSPPAVVCPPPARKVYRAQVVYPVR